MFNSLPFLIRYDFDSFHISNVKCYKLSALAVVAGNLTFLNFTLKVARRNGVDCNKQFSMVIIMLFFSVKQEVL